MVSDDPTRAAFDDSHHAGTALRKVCRALQLGPKYYLWDLPRYFVSRRRRKLPLWDGAALTNPLKEFRPAYRAAADLPPGYREALARLAEAGVRLTMAREKLEALLHVWWQVRATPGAVIECGAYRGATSLLLALLGR